MKRFLSALAVLILLAPSAAPAQRPPAVITGRVMILDSMRPAAGAFVRIQSHDVAAVADSAGRYRLVVPAQRIVDTAVVEVTASRVGLNEEGRQIPMTAGTEVVVDFGVKTSRLEPHLCQGTMVGVTGSVRHSVVVYEKLCRLTVVHGSRSPRDQAPDTVRQRAGSAGAGPRWREPP